jgi:acetyltransferase-like isoleucine patch superfamily enzyme
MNDALPGDLTGRVLARLGEAMTSPGGLRALVGGTVAIARARALFHGCELGTRVRAFGHVRVDVRGRLSLGDFVFFLAGMIPSEIVCHPGAEVRIGAHSGFNYGVSFDARMRITLGVRCLVGSMVRFGDTTRGGASPITIGDDVWIAHGAIIEPGVTIGDGSVVSAGSVVISDVPPGRLAIGNPARPVPLDVRSRGDAR